MTDTPMLDRAIAHSTAATDQLVGSPLLPAPESLADDIMVAAAFLQTEADRLAQLAGITPATPGERHNLAAAATFQARADRLFTHARYLTRTDSVPPSECAAEAAATIRSALRFYEEDLEDDDADWIISPAERSVQRERARDLLSVFGPDDDVTKTAVDALRRRLTTATQGGAA